MSEDGRRIELARAKERALLAVLLLNANRVVSSDRLIDALWEEHAPSTVQKALRVHISRLRKLLGSERLETRSPGYVLRVDDGELDLHSFEALVGRARSAPPAEACVLLGDALALWRGPPLADFTFDGFARVEIARLDEMRLAALEDRFEAELARGGHRQLVGQLEALVVEHPLRERLREQLMLALYRSGRQADALERYQTGRRVLVHELGIEPGRALRDLHEAILRQDRMLEIATVRARRGAFVGREAELEQLAAGLDDAFAGRGRLCLLVGEPGIGKSRLAEEVVARARARDARVLVGRCWEAGGAPAYWPWVQLLRSYARLADDAKLRDQLGRGAGELAQILPELRERLSDLPEPPSSDSESARFRLFDATTEFLRKVAAAQPVVLVLDDLHAADAPSLLLLQFLTRELDTIRVLVLAALRDVDPVPGQPLTALLTEVAREPGTRRLSLRGLSEAEVADYLEQTASAIASPRLAAALHEETEGNPFFVVETVQLLALEGVSPRSAGTGIAMPQSVRDVISRRFAHLSTGCKRVLVLASVLGREFEPAALARVEGKRESTILDAVREAAAAGVVTNVPDAAGRYRFAHVLIRDALYEGLTMERRIGLHLDVVGALATQHGEEPGPHLAELAHHSITGRDFEKGFDYATRAGDWALELLAYEEAARLYEVALDALARSNLRDEAAGCELLLSLGESHARAGDIPTAKRVFWQAAEAARELGAARQLALAAFGYDGRSMYGRAGDDDRLVPLLEEALTALGDSDVALRARLAARLAGALRDEPSRRRRDRLSSEAIEYARAAGDLSALAYALDGRAAAVMAPDTVAECFLLATELRDIAIGMGDQERVVHGHLHRLIAQVMQGDLDGAKADLEAMSRLADELRQPADFWQVAAAEAMLGLAMGRLDEAQELIDHAFAVGERSEPAMAIPVYRLQRYTLFDFLGRLEEVEPELRELVDAYPARTAMRCALVHLTARLGRTDEAGQMLAELAEDDFATLKFDNEWLFGMSLLAETCAMLGEAEPAMVLYQAGLPWASLNVLDHPEVVRGSVSRYLALLAATAGRWDEAAAHFEAAIELNGRMGLRPWLAHTQVDYARLLFARGELGLQGLAYELQEEALATYAALGMDTAVASGATRDTRSVLRLVD